MTACLPRGSYQSWRKESGWQLHDGFGSVYNAYAASTGTRLVAEWPTKLSKDLPSLIQRGCRPGRALVSLL